MLLPCFNPMCLTAGFPYVAYLVHVGHTKIDLSQQNYQKVFFFGIVCVFFFSSPPFCNLSLNSEQLSVMFGLKEVPSPKAA